MIASPVSPSASKSPTTRTPSAAERALRDAVHGAVGVRQAGRVVERVERRPEEAIHLVPRDAARRHDPRQARGPAMGAHGVEEPGVERRPIRVDAS